MRENRKVLRNCISTPTGTKQHRRIVKLDKGVGGNQIWEVGGLALEPWVVYFSYKI